MKKAADTGQERCIAHLFYCIFWHFVQLLHGAYLHFAQRNDCAKAHSYSSSLIIKNFTITPSIPRPPSSTTPRPCPAKQTSQKPPRTPRSHPAPRDHLSKTQTAPSQMPKNITYVHYPCSLFAKLPQSQTPQFHVILYPNPAASSHALPITLPQSPDPAYNNPQNNPKTAPRLYAHFSL